MQYTRIKWQNLLAVTAVASVFFITACNNEQSSDTESSPRPAENTTETLAPPQDSATGTTTPVTTSAGKKKGKVSVAAETTSKTEKMVADKSGYYNYAEVSPSYKGGQSAIENYISSNIEYPQDAIDNNIEGTVNVRFGIDENGNIANVSTLGAKIGYGLEEEAVRVIKDMGKWVPGTVKGKNVKTWMILPISYRIEG